MHYLEHLKFETIWINLALITKHLFMNCNSRICREMFFLFLKRCEIYIVTFFFGVSWFKLLFTPPIDCTPSLFIQTQLVCHPVSHITTQVNPVVMKTIFHETFRLLGNHIIAPVLMLAVWNQQSMDMTVILVSLVPHHRKGLGTKGPGNQRHLWEVLGNHQGLKLLHQGQLVLGQWNHHSMWYLWISKLQLQSMTLEVMKVRKHILAHTF